MAGALVGLDRHRTGLFGTLGGVGDIGGDLVERRGGLFQRGGLLLGTLGEVLRTLADLARSAVDRAGRFRHRRHGFAKLHDRAVEVLAQAFEFLGKGLRQLEAEIAGGKLLQAVSKSGGRLRHGFGADALLLGRAAALLLRLTALGVRLLLQTPVLQRVRAEHLHGRRHLADLVGAAGIGDRRVGVAAGESVHGMGDGLDRPRDAGDGKPDRAGDDDGKEADRCEGYRKRHGIACMGVVLRRDGIGDTDLGEFAQAGC
ncbi:hypothetical protein REJC140_02603 [Pseudorhizobium endolithicum]|uniref:Uncharacterized protein n=1 Tax=Pseudorhizobium endolithicum TaxID=1191678 RepID=A0ABM8PGA2_9HYPH|nr:hypothetical protein REJC140_02603 [Pseudorhizobium endolithicum]